ncbi:MULTISPECIES: class I SAM-dependent methyltransferase [unclassified Paenibacillus]|uniref:class I SAM-dependent methyltransferase n=1 Tax=unclassified Paenibacillus TaxID=185978 RepID=UPI00095550BD|nr:MULTISPECIES: class I SAM-dependent methyltransferase [unclassified Paenibacillus]ASS64914.1 methyltransferase domain-containing protein [Paenibacillus sp. RUD330]SIR01667.1 methyltransferase, FkbM family [Paenibacillus sp. RU4X]SIR33461.1 methyltransferase, FkbM family [Paenibacillus sp. RU4T]
MPSFFDAAVWEQEWKHAGDTLVNTMKKAGIDPSRSFDSKAASFNEQSFSAEGRKRTDRIIAWLEGQGVPFHNASVLDIGAASGVFSVPFAERGAHVTAVESSPPLIGLLQENMKKFGLDKTTIVSEPFEAVDVQARGWSQAFDLVFVSMCPVILDWESVEKVLRCARQFCYISMPAGSRVNSLAQEIWPLLADRPFKEKETEFGYFLHLLYLKGYSYESLVTREMKSAELSIEEALQEAMHWLRIYGLPSDERSRKTVADYLERTYPSGKVAVQEGGRFGKVVIRLQDPSMPERTVRS